MRPILKNCGLKTPESIAESIRTGASFIGLVHYDASPRHLSIEEGTALRAHIMPPTHCVAVLVSPDDALLENITQHWKPDFLQIHGVEDVARLAHIRMRYALPLIIGWPVGSTADIVATERLRGIADYVLLDTKKADSHGGTGIPFDWQWLASVQPPLPWFLAGGLNIDNVVEALRITRASAVDVSSGLESSPGIKSLEKIAAFNHAVLHGAHEQCIT